VWAKQQSSAAGKVTVGLTSQWPCVTDSVANGLRKGDQHPAYTPVWSMTFFTFLLQIRYKNKTYTPTF